MDEIKKEERLKDSDNFQNNSSKSKESFDINKRKFIKKGFLAILAGVGAAILANTPFVKATNYLNNISLGTALPIAQGGTASTSAGDARTALGVKDVIGFGRGGVLSDGNLIVERYSAEAGQVGLVDTGNSTAVYSTAEDSYGQGVVQTNILYNSTTVITSLLVEEITKSSVTQGTVDVSFDAGSSWAAGKAIGSEITDFTGTSADGSDYKLKLKFTLGATYDSATAFMWVTTGSLSEAKSYLAGCGTTVAALCFSGYFDSTRLNTTEKWDGSSWVTTSDLTEAKHAPGGCGTTAAALCFGGDASPKTNTTEKWDGSSWATTGVLTTVKQELAGCGTTAAALCFGGDTGSRTNITEKWSGSSWATTTTLTEVKSENAGCGTTAAALNFGGTSGAAVNTTEIWEG